MWKNFMSNKKGRVSFSALVEWLRSFFTTDRLSGNTLEKQKRTSNGQQDKSMTAESKDIRKRTGDLGEEIASDYLTARRFSILERNFRCRGGEVDIIAREAGSKCLVFVEVKTRKDLSYGVPQLAVTPFKQRQISKAALTWIAKNNQHDQNARFDVIAILLDARGQHKVEHIVNAFDLAY